MKTAFVTGGTGFVGLNLVALLRAQGWHVVAIAAHLAAVTRGRTGDSYLLGGTEASYVDVGEIVAGLLGVPRPRAIPAWLLKALGQVNEWASYLTRREI